jgi:deoxyribonuclease V
LLCQTDVLLPAVLPYRPGEFFLRELPPLRAVLAQVRNLGLLIIDGYVDLDPGGRPGLGAHAHAAFGVPVTGVAKTRFRRASHAVQVLRGSSARPLFVTAAGIPLTQAADLVRRMAGPFRLPDALRRVDALAVPDNITPAQADRQPNDPCPTLSAAPMRMFPPNAETTHGTRENGASIAGTPFCAAAPSSCGRLPGAAG